MELILKDVPYIAQPTLATCWNAAYKMMLAFKGKDPSAADCLPNDKEMRRRGIYDSEFLPCRDRLGLTSSSYEEFLTAESIENKLETHGPIWVSGRYCEGIYKHIVVLVGVKRPRVLQDEVLIHDPYRGYKYSLSMARWVPLDRIVKNINRVPFSCQHW